MLLYIMLYIVLAYLMLFAALTNAVCLYNASFFATDFCKCFYFHGLSLLIDTVCLFHFFICIMHSAFNLFIFPNCMFTFFVFLYIFFGYVL